MQRRQILKIVPFFLCAWASVTYAQNPPNSIAQLFDQAAAKHKRELADLAGFRKTPIMALPDVSSHNIARVLEVREEQIDADEAPGQVAYPDKTAVLFYSYEKDNLQVWLVDKKGIQAYQKQRISDQQIDAAIVNLRNLLDVDSLQESRAPRYQSSKKVVPVKTSLESSLNQAIAHLTQILLPAPVANKLDAVAHLIVVPIFQIGAVPYAILQPFQDNSFLIDRMSISIAPSLFDLGARLSPWNSQYAFASPLIVGNPDLPKSSGWSIPPLTGAEQEAQAVAKMLNAVPLIGKKATKTEIVARAVESSLLYFATHGIASPLNPLSDGFLMLSAASFEQGWWTAKEIQRTRLRAKIAVL
ncbi:MAG: CHAT domain-containing protein, partial [Leptolyngbyaceae bacterium]|nr:CHAT domain-containing protein [Leptolyngbyaceae bacterium]